MDKRLEKTLEKALDKLLQSTLEKRYFALMDERFLNLTKSKEDFLLGIVVGDMLEGLGFCTYGVHKRYPKDKEFRKLFRMIERRSDEIESRIETILSKQDGSG
ncbi:MAG: hypothetical protein JSV64_00980 [Candidatus Bathyarchaeota archaeon]|nr:MAG: hypothetical protein JSV64_00980 [Candidatus Bathyarchaeota archaeon]